MDNQTVENSTQHICKYNIYKETVRQKCFTNKDNSTGIYRDDYRREDDALYAIMQCECGNIIKQKL